MPGGTILIKNRAIRATRRWRKSRMMRSGGGNPLASGRRQPAGNLRMPDNSPAAIDPAELNPQLLYRVDGGQARFATWRLTDGHEALALFTTAEAATKYCDDLEVSAGWTAYQPPR